MTVNEPTENESIKRTKQNELECIAYVWAILTMPTITKVYSV